MVISTALFNCLLFHSFINITSSNMESKAKRDQIVILNTAGINNCDMTKQLDVCRRAVVPN